jgi:hypothetical protein
MFFNARSNFFSLWEKVRACPELDSGMRESK